MGGRLKASWGRHRSDTSTALVKKARTRWTHGSSEATQFMPVLGQVLSCEGRIKTGFKGVVLPDPEELATTIAAWLDDRSPERGGTAE